MSSISSASKKQPARQYVSAAPFHNDLFSYTTSYNAFTNVTTGTLSAPIAGANSSTCPAGRILRESGKKLYPGSHVGVTTYMVGVIDSASGLAGYIDPNSPVFAVSNNEIPVFFANGVDPGPGGLEDEGQPVYTNGPIVTAGNATIGGNEVVTGTTVSKGQIRCVGATGARVEINGASSTNINIDVGLRPFVYITGNANNTITCSNINFGDHLILQFGGSGGSPGTATFSSGFAVSSTTMAKGASIIHFICDGVHMVELSRTTWENVFDLA